MEHVNCTAVVPLGPQDTKALALAKNYRGATSVVNLRMDVYNSMSFDVFIVNRQNMKMLIPRTPIVEKGKLVFVYSWTITSITRVDMKKVSTTDDMSNSVEVKALMDRWMTAEFNGIAQSSLRSNDEFFYVVDEKMLRNKKCIYLRDIDWVVALKSHLKDHPYSNSGQLHGVMEKVDQEVVAVGGSSRNFTLSLIINDNAGKIGPRWIQFHGAVFKIPTEKDPERKDGFYIISDKAVNDATDHPVRYADFKESEADLDFPVYKSFHEAELAGDTEAMFKLRNTLIERENREIELKIKSDRNEQDLARLREEARLFEMRSEQATLNHQREMRNLQDSMEQEMAKAANEREKFRHDRERFEQDRTQFEHEKVIQGQKNASDTFKTIGGLITSIVGIILLFSKILKV